MLAGCLCAEVVLTNDTVLKLVRARIGEDSIIGMVNQQPGVYALSADDLAALKRAGVTEKVIAAMLVRNGAVNVPVTEPTPAASTSTSTHPAPLILRDAVPITLKRNPLSADVTTGDHVGPAPVSQPVPQTNTGEAITPPVVDKAEMTITSNPGSASVEIDGVSVGATPVTVKLAKGANCTLSVKKDGFMAWTANYSPAITGKFTINATLTPKPNGVQ